MRVENLRPDPCITIRPGEASDAEPLRRFLNGLSTRSAYLRFFTGLGRVPDRLLGLLLQRGHDQEVILAVHDGEIIGHGMYTALPDRDGVAELALVVADAWQRRGLGQLLAQGLMDAALQRGFGQLGLTVLADNQPAIRLVARVWPAARPAMSGGAYEYVVPLAEPIAA